MANVKLKGTQKIAVLMTVIGPERAAHLLRQFEPEEQARIAQAMVEIEDLGLDEAALKNIIEDFRRLLQTGGSAIPNVEKTLSEILARMHGAEEGKKMVANLREATRITHPFRSLRGLRAIDFAKILLTEHPQVQAIVLTHLDHEQAAAVLDAIPEAERPALVARMAAIEEPSARVLKQVAHEIIERTRGLKREDDADPDKPDPRLETVAKVLLNAHPGNDRKILESIETSSQDLAARIRERMFEWNDLALIDKRTMQRILADVDTRLLALGLKACDDGVRDKILGAVSQRTADMIRDERDLLGSVPLKDVLDAQNQILTNIREMISKGEISVARGKSAAYVA